MSHWGKSAALFAVALSVVGGLKTPATAVTPTTTDSIVREPEPTSVRRQGNLHLAQGLVGQCRAAKQRIFVYSQRSTTSPTVRTLAPNEQVTLADDGAAGWIAISSPEAGYVRASDLVTCQGVTPPRPNPTPNPTPSPAPNTSSLCRIVTYNGPEGGLAIRSRPDRSAPRVDGVRLGDRVTLRTSPPPATLDKEGRSWIEITAPSRGWISNGFPNSRSANTGLCP
jgi:hypothetical protein